LLDTEAIREIDVRWHEGRLERDGRSKLRLRVGESALARIERAERDARFRAIG
jgi:hypothetical protein